MSTLGLQEHLTHKANLRQTRYGWLRLTPAYSVHLVAEILRELRQENPVVLDPFCGTGTTALACAERGIQADTTDINPFLIWLAAAKTRAYPKEWLAAFQSGSTSVAEAMSESNGSLDWVPPLHQIEKWWDEETLRLLSRAMAAITQLSAHLPAASSDLLKIAFCRLSIDLAQVSFGHQSMSFKQDLNGNLFQDKLFDAMNCWQQACEQILLSARTPIVREPRVILCDARQLAEMLPANHYSCIVTSPPYPNRMSYIRELRPYMYWLKYLQDAREAGELDWQAIGGTWGVATSNVGKWTPDVDGVIPYSGFELILEKIAERSALLSRYVHKYFYDMAAHAKQIFAVTRPGGSINYVIGNSKFYDVLLPAEKIFAELFKASGFNEVKIKTIRKRTSKKELYEYLVSARKS